MKVTIGSTDYDLKLVDIEKEKPEELEGNPLAFIDSINCRIRVSESLEKQVKLQSLWHEIVHGILEEIGRTEVNEDEGFVDAFAKQLYMLHGRNNLEKIYNYVGGA